MKVLIVDNGTHYKKRLLSLVGRHQVSWVSYDELDPQVHTQGFDLIVLSGAYKTYEVKNYADSIYAKEKELIKKAAPGTVIVGICLGAQLIGYMYGAKLSVVPSGKKIKGIKRIWNVIPTPFDFFRYYGGKVWASQKWRITELPDELECWCASGEGVEVFKDKKKPVYGLQFHPEHHTKDDDGKKIFDKILQLEFRAKS